ncbi:MAG: hypothetical protein FD122_1929 [Stygiobacter sp.]|nr:MAG: hypothetical protein FD122_1929 [Stygiobacter sp.]KAF0211641.1 MAG: hypothetical protein FD178_3375 [Ignavibacteria bacterium]
MRRVFLFLLVFSFSVSAQTYLSSSPLAHTYSIVAFDPETGDMGVAVQSHWFSVGSIVTWGEAGVGVVATQSFVNPAFGPDGLALLKAGKSPQEAVDELIKNDEGRDVRQLAILDSKGRVATWTGKKCIQAAGHITGTNFSVQANMMLNDKVWGAMNEAFTKAKGLLAERMMAALEAAQSVGGDIRGKQSAAMLVVRAKSTGKVWEDRLVDLRVEDSTEPLKEIRRLINVHSAYGHMNNGDLAVEKNDMAKAMQEYSAAMQMFPQNLEMKYWTAITLANKGKIDEALPMLREIFKKDKNWKTLTERLVPVGLLTVSDEDLKKILK